MDNFSQEVKFFMIYDILGDVVRSGPLLWHVDRKRLEDVKNHSLDLMLIIRLLRKYLPSNLDYDKMFDYAMFHDLPEAITGDITGFQGVSSEEKRRVNNIAIDYLDNLFNDIMDIGSILHNFEDRVDIEAMVVHMIDSFHSVAPFMKYQSEKTIDMSNPTIIPELRNLPFVIKAINEGRDVADVFFDYHIKAIEISPEECLKYGITPEYAKSIVNPIKCFMEEMYNCKLNGTLLARKSEFPIEAMEYVDGR